MIISGKIGQRRQTSPLPPLRKRRGELALLTQMFLNPREGGRKFQAAILLIFALVAMMFQPASTAVASPPRQDIPPAYQRVAENNWFQLYVDSATLAFKLVDKRNNYVWDSGIDAPIEGDRLNRSWRAFAQSGISIEYLDEAAVNKRVSITNAPHKLDVLPITDGISAVVTFQDYGISVGVNLQLEADGVRVEIPSASIREANPKFRLGLVYVYPFLGAARGGSIPGYMFMPDGTGSLIRFGDTTKAKNMFYGRYYGRDLGLIAVQPWNAFVNTSTPISYPVFGMVHGEGKNAFLAVIEKGASYGEVQVHPAGITTNFNFINNAFIYNQSYFQATNRSGAGVTTVQKQSNSFEMVMHYRFLAGDAADYVGMARSYQQYLVGRGILQKRTEPNPNIGIRLEVLGGDKEKILLWHQFIRMTTIRQIDAMLTAMQLANPQIIYYGWQPYGATNMPPDALHIEGALGNIPELRALVDKVEANGGRFSLYLDPQSALRDEPGYSERNDLATAITGVNMRSYTRYPAYYLTFDTIQRNYAALSGNIASHMNAGLALDSIGSILYSDFREGHERNREAALQATQTLFAGSLLRLSFYRPNDYLFGAAHAYYDMPLGDNGYIYTDEAVPFLPIVLAGYMPYYGGALNFSSNLQEDLLRHIDFGIYPSFFLTHEPTATMINTPSFWIYSSSYAQWGEEIRRTYARMNGLLAPVRGQEIVARRRLAAGVFATTYANGRQVVVNYTDAPYVHNGTTIPAKDAALLTENKP
jgi:hypothetical protein